LERAADVSHDLHRELEALHATLARTSICGLGQVALGPLLSILRNFPDASERD